MAEIETVNVAEPESTTTVATNTTTTTTSSGPELVVADYDRYNLNLFNEVYSKIRGMISNKTYSASNWITLVIMAMEMVDTLPKLHGHQKRDLVVDIITKLITEIPMSESDRITVAAVCRTTLPSIIDAVVDGTLGNLNINAVVDSVSETYNNCVGRCKRKEKSSRHLRRR